MSNWGNEQGCTPHNSGIVPVRVTIEAINAMPAEDAVGIPDPRLEYCAV